MGTGRMLEKCPLMYSCSGSSPIWLNSKHPTVEEEIVEGEASTNLF